MLVCKSVNVLFVNSPAESVQDRSGGQQSCWGCCRGTRAALSHTGAVLSGRCVLAAWHGWGEGSSARFSCVLSVLVPCFAESLLCSPESVLQWLPALRLCCSVRGFSLGQPFLHTLLPLFVPLRFPIFYCLSKLAQL